MKQASGARDTASRIKPPTMIPRLPNNATNANNPRGTNLNSSMGSKIVNKKANYSNVQSRVNTNNRGTSQASGASGRNKLNAGNKIEAGLGKKPSLNSSLQKPVLKNIVRNSVMPANKSKLSTSAQKKRGSHLQNMPGLQTQQSVRSIGGKSPRSNVSSTVNKGRVGIPDKKGGIQLSEQGQALMHLPLFNLGSDDDKAEDGRRSQRSKMSKEKKIGLEKKILYTQK